MCGRRLVKCAAINAATTASYDIVKCLYVRNLAEQAPSSSGNAEMANMSEMAEIAVMTVSSLGFRSRSIFSEGRSTLHIEDVRKGRIQ